MHLLCFYEWPPTKHPPTISVRTPCGRTNSLQFMPKVPTMPPCSILLETGKPVVDLKPSGVVLLTDDVVCANYENWRTFDHP